MADYASDSGRLLVVGDIHGCDLALETLLERLKLQTSDKFVVLGDAIDRGPDSRRVLDVVCEIEQRCQLVFILGNHEEMLLDVLAGARPHFWLSHGGAATLASYGGSVTQIPDQHLDMLSRTVSYWESSATICVHANLEPGVDLKEQRSEWLRWQALTGFEFPHESGKQVICGHTGQPSGLPLIRDGWICLDTLAYTGGFLTCIDLASENLHQSKQSGEYRTFHLNDLRS